jgi:hypothetical protein
MVHVVFDTATVGYDDFIQTGGGPTDVGESYRYEIFKGGPAYMQRGYGIQHGAGITDVLRGVWRFFLPLIRRVGTTVGEEALNTGQRVMEKLHEGQPLKEAVISEGKKGIDTVLDKGGFQKQFGTGKKRIKRPKNSQSILSQQSIIGRTISKPLAHSKKRLRSDAFGLY